jgi:hypothetical protein
MTEEDERFLTENTRDIALQMSPDDYLAFLQQYNEMIGHKQRRPKPIRGVFKL